MTNIFTAVCTVTRDCEVKYLPSGGAVLNVNVANNQGFKDKQTTMFIRCALFGKRAEGQLQDFLKKGQQVMVSGELSMREYQANDGTTKTSLELNCNILDLVGGKRDGGQAQQQPQTQAIKPQEVFEDSDIPF